MTPTLEPEKEPNPSNEIQESPRTLFRLELERSLNNYRGVSSTFTYPDLTWGICLSVRAHYEKYGNTDSVKNYVFEEVGKLLATTGFPVRVDYSITDPSGAKNHAEEMKYQSWKNVLTNTFSDPKDLAEIGRRAIGTIIDDYTQNERHHWTNIPSNTMSTITRRIVRIAIELGTSITPEHPELCSGLQKVLPASFCEYEEGYLFKYFPEAFSDKKTERIEAGKACIEKKLEDVKVRWYGDSHRRFQDTTELKKSRKVPTTEKHKEYVLEYIEQYSLDEEYVTELKECYELSNQEVRDARIKYISTRINNWEFDPDYARMHCYSLKEVAKDMQRDNISVSDLNIDPISKLPAVLATKNIYLIKLYIETMELPLAVLREDLSSTMFQEAVQGFLRENFQKRREDCSLGLEALENWQQSELAELVEDSITTVGNELIIEDNRYALSSYLSFVGMTRNISSHRNRFASGIESCVKMHLENANCKRLEELKTEFKVDFSNDLFKDATIEGVKTIFRNTPLKDNVEKKLNEFVKLCNLNGIDNPELRTLVVPRIVKALNAENIKRAAQYIKYFNFKKPIAGEDIRAATIKAFQRTLRDANGFGLRYVSSNISADLSIKDMSQALLEVWEEPNMQAKILEVLRFIPEALQHALNRNLALYDYQRDIGVAGIITYSRYMQFYKSGQDLELKGFVAQVREEMDALISSEEQTVAELYKNPRYRELILTVFPNHWGPSATFESTESCPDRSTDLDEYRIRKGQSITLAAGVTMELKAGEEYDSTAADKLENQIETVLQQITKKGRNKKKIQEQLLELAGSPKKLESLYSEILSSLLSDKINSNQLTSVLIGLRLLEFEDLRNYFQATRAEVEESVNQQYANTVELQRFLGDHMSEAIKKLIREGLKNSNTKIAAQQFCRKLALKQTGSKQQTILDRARPEKLGLSDSFLAIIEKSTKGVKQLSNLNSKDVVALSEASLGETDELELLGVPKNVAKRLKSIVLAQREKSHKLLEQLAISFDKTLGLEELNLHKLIETANLSDSLLLDDQAVEALLYQYFLDSFKDYTDAFNQEVAKFSISKTSTTKSNRREINCYMTKNHTSAHALKSAGVCISMCTPANSNKEGENFWELSESFLDVLQDKETKICLGATILHIYDYVEDGKNTKILTASFNPSSTFLYQVDEKELFQKLFARVKTFAMDNKISKVCVSQHRYIRTNRTGGAFEDAIDNAINKVDEQLFLYMAQFSFHPKYSNNELQVVWKQPKSWFGRSVEKLWNTLTFWG